MEETHRRWIPQTTQGEGRMGLTDKAIGLRKLGLKWLQGYLQSRGNSNQVFTNHNYPCCLSVLTLEHIEEEHVTLFLESAGTWLSHNKFWTRQNDWLLKKTKEEIFKVWIENIRDRFPTHPLVQLGDAQNWFQEMKGRFLKGVIRKRTLDPAVFETRKSKPLYRNLGTENHLVQAKYATEKEIDCKSIHMNMIRSLTADKNPREAYNIACKLSELNTGKAACIRGGEIIFPRWNEGAYDPYFRTIDMDWSIVKQNERQCMMVFCDLTLDCLCPYFAWGVYFLFGGLKRDNVSPAVKDFVYPHLHKNRRDAAARQMTDTLRKYIDMSDLEALAVKFKWSKDDLTKA